MSRSARHALCTDPISKCIPTALQSGEPQIADPLCLDVFSLSRTLLFLSHCEHH